MFLGNSKGGTSTFLAYENNGNEFIRRSDWDPPTYYIGCGGEWNASLDLVDLDNNNTKDLVFTNNEWGHTFWYKNIGTQSSPIWRLDANKYPYYLAYQKYHMVDVGPPGLHDLTGDILDGTAGFGDLNNDNDPDMLMGAEFVIAFENIGYAEWLEGENVLSLPFQKGAIL